MNHTHHRPRRIRCHLRKFLKVIVLNKTSLFRWTTPYCHNNSLAFTIYIKAYWAFSSDLSKPNHQWPLCCPLEAVVTAGRGVGKQASGKGVQRWWSNKRPGSTSSAAASLCSYVGVPTPWPIEWPTSITLTWSSYLQVIRECYSHEHGCLGHDHPLSSYTYVHDFKQLRFT